MSDDPLPALRRLASVVESVEGDARLRLRDPLGVSPMPDGLALTPAEWRVAAALDGRRSADQVAEELALGGGAGAVRELAYRLSDALLLDDEAFEQAVDERLEQFRRRPTRSPIGAGVEYPRDAFDLRLEVGGLVANDWDMPSVSSLAGVWTPAAPHRRAGALYARSWSALRSQTDAARILLLGAVDCELGRPLVPLDRDLETPLGTVATDREGVAALGVLPGRDVLVHTTSAVLERQALFLRVICPEVAVVPVLVSALRLEPADEAHPASFDPAGRSEVEASVEALERVLQLDGRTPIVCAADLQRLAGVGASGAPAPDARFVLGGSAGKRLRGTDASVVDAATRLSAAELLGTALEGSGPRAASLLHAPYLLLRVLHSTAPAELRGSTLGYLQMPARHELTTGVSVAFHCGPDDSSLEETGPEAP